MEFGESGKSGKNFCERMEKFGKSLKNRKILKLF